MRLLCWLCLLLWTQSLAAKDLYVSAKGNDSHPGTRQQPFATLDRARVEAGKYSREAVVVYVMEGTYYLTSTLRFTTADSRTAKASLRFEAYRGQYPVVKGSRKVSLDFKPGQGGIWVATLPAGLPEMDQLYVDGALQVMARYPNYQPAVKPLQGTAANVISADRVRSWQQPAGGYIHALHGSEWGGMHYRITGKKDDSTLLWEGGWQNNRPSPMHKQYRYVENILEELDSVGEWYADHSRRLLYYKPAKDIDLQKAVFEVPVVESLVSLQGRPGSLVQYISFNGIRFEHTLRTFMKNREPLLRSDWTIDRSAAIFFEYAANCSLIDCDLFALGGNAVFFSNYNVGNAVKGCHIHDIGAGAINVVGNPSAVRSPAFRYEAFVPYAELDLTVGPKGNDFPVNCLVEDNLIHDIGLVEKQVAGVQLSMAQSITIRYNTIYNVPRAGINVSEGTWGGHEISYNEVFNTVQETGDHGAFNSWGRDRFWHPRRATMDSLMAAHPGLWRLDAVLPTRIHNNRFRCDNGWDIDLDDGSSNYYIYNNICLNGGLKLREGFHRVVENNIILNNSFHPHVWFANSLDTFRHNIVSGPYLPIRINDWGTAVDYNFFPDSASLAKVQGWGVDQHSRAGKLFFASAATGNYFVSSMSPASLVFRNFDQQVGTRSKRLVKLAAKLPLPVLMTSAGLGEDVAAFLGMKVKNLHTLAERSATGMDRETGVLVVEVPAASVWHSLVQPNDVILELGGEPVNKVPDLLKARMKVQWHATVPVVIFRDQKRQEMKLPLK